jgi:hypothetical protein
MVVDDLDVFRPCLRPSETNAVLVVYPDAVLTGAAALQSFQPVSRWDAKVFEPPGDLELSKLASRYRLDLHEPLDPLAARETLGVRILEGNNHGERITLRVINVKRYYWQRRQLPLSGRTNQGILGRGSRRKGPVEQNRGAKPGYGRIRLERGYWLIVGCFENEIKSVFGIRKEGFQAWRGRGGEPATASVGMRERMWGSRALNRLDQVPVAGNLLNESRFLVGE